MANRQKGEVEIQVDGTTYTFALDINAMAWLEDKYSTAGKEMSFHEIWARLERAKRIKDVRTIMTACLLKHHPTITEEQVGDIMQAAGGLSGFNAELRAQILAAAHPDPKDLQALGVKPNGNPPKAQPNPSRGRGDRSTSARGRSD